MRFGIVMTLMEATLIQTSNAKAAVSGRKTSKTNYRSLVFYNPQTNKLRIILTNPEWAATVCNWAEEKGFVKLVLLGEL